MSKKEQVTPKVSPMLKFLEALNGLKNRDEYYLKNIYSIYAAKPASFMKWEPYKDARYGTEEYTPIFSLFMAIYSNQPDDTINKLIKKILKNWEGINENNNKAVLLSWIFDRMPLLIPGYEETPVCYQRYRYPDSHIFTETYDKPVYNRLPNNNLFHAKQHLGATAKLGNREIFEVVLNQFKKLNYPTRDLYLTALSAGMTASQDQKDTFIQLIIDLIDNENLTSRLRTNNEKWAALKQSTAVNKAQSQQIVTVFQQALTSLKDDNHNLSKLMGTLLAEGENSLLGLSKDHPIYQRMVDQMLWASVEAGNLHAMSELTEKGGKCNFSLADKSKKDWYREPKHYIQLFQNNDHEEAVAGLISAAQLNTGNTKAQETQLNRTFQFLFKVAGELKNEDLIKLIAQKAADNYVTFRKAQPEQTTTLFGIGVGHDKKTKTNSAALWKKDLAEGPAQNSNKLGFFDKRKHNAALTKGRLGELHTMYKETMGTVHRMKK